MNMTAKRVEALRLVDSGVVRYDPEHADWLIAMPGRDAETQTGWARRNYAELWRAKLVDITPREDKWSTVELTSKGREMLLPQR